METAPSSKLRIENIPGVCTDDDVIGWALVDHNPDVPDCLFEKDGNGIHQGIAFVTFSSVEQAVVIKNKLDGTEVFGQEIRVDFVAETERETAEKPPSVAEHGEAKELPSKTQKPNEGNQGGTSGAAGPSLLDKRMEEIRSNLDAGKTLSEEDTRLTKEQLDAKAKEVEIALKVQQDAGERYDLGEGDDNVEEPIVE